MSKGARVDQLRGKTDVDGTRQDGMGRRDERGEANVYGFVEARSSGGGGRR